MKNGWSLAKQDRTLALILLGIIGLVIISLVIFFIRPDSQVYGTEDSPAGVARNYILALQKGDYSRAYSYFRINEKPADFDKFQNEFLARKSDSERVSVQIGQTEQTGEKALVGLTILHPANGPFGDVWRESGSAILVKDQVGDWKILNMPYTFWSANWYPQKLPTP